MNIRTKLVALISIPTLAIVLSLTLYFPTRQVAATRKMLLNRVDTYGAIMGTQLQSAVAFDDRATAQELLSSLRVDRDIAAVTLFGADTQALYSFGTPSKWVEQARRGVVAAKTVAVGDRISIVTPVTSAEGPRGTLVIEISTARLQAESDENARTALQLGLGAALAAILVALIMSRSMSRRIIRIADAASAVSAGDLARRVAPDAASDEIATLATAINQMVMQLHTEQATLEAMVRELRDADAALLESNRSLERRVEARTAELTRSNQKLVFEMEERARMEIVLRQAQKLEAAGRLAAGVAHEINTPVQFINDSLFFVRDAVKDVFQVLSLYRKACGALVEARDAKASEESVDIDYLFDNIPPAFERTFEGLSRVTTIVRSMKEFAHPDQREMHPVDLNQGVQATLTIATHEYKYVADLETELGEIPQVVCHAGDVNQVVLNLVVNAAHAIGDVVKDSGEKGKIKVRTYLEAEFVVITVTDTGCGIPVDARPHLFEPFFTTKEVGKGTGQGLAIARSVVVDKHGGSLDFDTELGHGTTFIIRLPIAGRPATARPGGSGAVAA
jgi:signal transduction histidine kinase